MNRRYTFYYVASVYLLYLVYELVVDIKNGESDNVPFSICIAVFFAIAACAISLYAYKKSKAEKVAEAEKARAEEKALEESGGGDDVASQEEDAEG